MNRLPTHRDERGLSESVQWALLTPVLLLMVLGCVQGGIWLHGRTVATHAALAGAEAQSLASAGGQYGERVARDVAEAGGLRAVEVRVARGGDVEVSVSGRVDGFFDLGLVRVHATATMPGEQPR